MHTNPFFLALLSLIALAGIWYSGVAGYRYYNYVTLTQKAPVTSVKWSVQEEASDSFRIHAHYHFTTSGKTYEGNDLFKTNYLNAWAAQQDIKSYEARKWLAWYQPSNPHHSALQKNFPAKECITALVVWGLFLYFLWLGFYVSKYRF